MKKIILALMVVFVCFSIGMAQSGKKATVQEKKDLFQQISKDTEISEALNDFEGGADRMAKSLIVKKIDINNDKKPEYIVVLEESGLCGAHMNCPNWVYQKTGSDYRLLLRTRGESLLLEKTSTNKFRDISSSGSNSAIEESIDIYKFDGTKYQASKCVTSVCEPGKKCKIIPGKCEANN